MKVKFYVSSGAEACSKSEILDLPDDMTNEEIEEFYQEWMWGKIDSFWEKIEGRNDQ